jgi:hypothetical protein
MGCVGQLTFKNLTLDVKKSNSSNETPNVMTVGVGKYGLNDKLSKDVTRNEIGVYILTIRMELVIIR